MKFLIPVLVVAVMFISNTVTAQKKVKITATVVNVNSNEGKIGFALYNKDNFMMKAIVGADGKIIDGKSTVVFKDVLPGEYAIVCYHDKNNNNKMDFTPNKMPLENYGASNNKLNPYGPPTFEAAKFLISDKDVSLKIKF